MKAGKLSALAVSSREPSPLAPEVPTLAKALNQPSLDVSFKLVLQAARGTPAPVVAELERAAIDIMKKPEVRARLQASDLVSIRRHQPGGRSRDEGGDGALGAGGQAAGDQGGLAGVLHRGARLFGTMDP